jgi:PIN domain nuclease of toxin-antitoxin system
VRLLLNTHIFLWWITDDYRLSQTMCSRIMQATAVYVSSASIWEMAIKIKRKKLEANIDEIVASMFKNSLLELPITALHAAATYSLPLIHHDPFDHILVAQSLCEPLILLTDDALLQRYSSHRIAINEPRA